MPLISEIPIETDAGLAVALLVMARADRHDVGQHQSLVFIALDRGSEDEIDKVDVPLPLPRFTSPGTTTTESGSCSELS